jgi:hypothetical protein
MSEVKPLARQWLWRITSIDDAYQMARESFGGAVFAILTLFGAVSALISAMRMHELSFDDISNLIGMILAFATVVLCAYRVRIGKGWIAGLVLVLMDTAEIYLKVRSGALTNPGWIAFHLAIFVSILMGEYACWQVRQRLRRGEVRTEIPVIS